MGKNEVKDNTREMDDKRWQEEIQGKSSLEIYEEEKKEIKEELMYNRPSSVIMYRARTNCLKLNDRNRHQGGEVGCKLCGANIEKLEHFLLECEKLGEERRRIGKCIQYVPINFYRKKNIEITTKHPILCSSINNMWGKTLITTNKLEGPVGKKGVLGGVYRLRMHEKPQKT